MGSKVSEEPSVGGRMLHKQSTRGDSQSKQSMRWLLFHLTTVVLIQFTPGRQEFRYVFNIEQILSF